MIPIKPNEIPFKQWRSEEGEKYGISEHGIYYRYRRGKYPKLKLRRAGTRTIFVKLK